MEAIQVYHNPRCSKSRMALEYLHSKSINFESVLYLENKLTENELKGILKKLNISPLELLRKGEETYKNEIKNKSLSDNELIKMMIKHPNLIERPIVIKGNKAVIARPTELIETILFQ
jgi:arsenate reductase (glutaredoxin)